MSVNVINFDMSMSFLSIFVFIPKLWTSLLECYRDETYSKMSTVKLSWQRLESMAPRSWILPTWAASSFRNFFKDILNSGFWKQILKIVKEPLGTTDGTLVGRFQAEPAGSDCTLPCSNHFTVSIFCVQKGSQNIDKIWSTKLPTLLWCFSKSWKLLLIFRRQSQSAAFAQSWPVWISISSRRRFWLVNAPDRLIGQFTQHFIPSLSTTFRAIFYARISHALSGGFKLFTNHSLLSVKRRLN